MSSLVLFGAGASYGQATTREMPPLGADLFRQLRARGGEWSDPELAGKFEGRDFEHAMRELLKEEETAAAITPDKGFEWHANSPSPRSARLQWGMADFFFRFELADDSLYERFVHLLKEPLRKGDVRIATLNYDRLLFQALERVSIPFRATEEDLQPVRICLPHGSSALSPPAKLCRDGRLVTFGRYVEVNPARRGGFASNGPVRFFNGIDDLAAARSDNHLPPVMSFVEPAKESPTAYSYIISERQRWARWADEAERIAIIGVHVHEVDTHIWDPLAKTSANLLYVGGRDAEKFNDWENDKRKSPGPPARNWRWDDAFDDVISFLRRRS